MILFSLGALAAPGKVKIGLSMDTLKEERWQKDRDLFVKRAKELGAEVLVQAANGNDALQLSQSENLLTQGVDILVVVPHNGVVASAIVTAAKKAGKKVIAYDRMIENSDVDLYLSFDNLEVGRMQARYALSKAPQGNYMVIGGAPTDHNAKLYRQGQMEVLKPAVDSGKIKIVADPWAREWLASEALKHTENALSKNKDNIQAIVAPNDGTAGGVISALKQQKLAGKVIVTGQDADLAACQRVVEGSQSMTVYKPIEALAKNAAEVAVALAKGETLPATKNSINNGKKDVPAILVKPILVDKSNMDQTVIKDGYHKKADVYKNI
ncbi:MAG: D-xylose ABC transporter substrate-binding protein [Bdellovibrionales bacterium]